MQSESKESKLLAKNMTPRLIQQTLDRKTMARQKREYTRMELSLPVSILAGGGAIDGEVKNLSLGGACIILRELPSLNGVPLSLVVELPGCNYAILATAEVVRMEIYDVDGPSISYSLGVKFIDISEDDLSFLATKVFH
jgi:hypothetical protein